MALIEKEFQPVLDLSQSGKELLAAFVKFSADVGNVDKNKENPHFKSAYADLAGAMTACREHLAKHELAVMQHPFNAGSDLGITTMLIHTSGQFISSDFILRPVRGDPQSVGSAVTYARRYAYMSILGIAAEDDDGNAASARASDGQKHQQNRNQNHQNKQNHQPRPGQNNQAAAPGAQASPPKTEFFDLENPAHLDRLAAALEERKVAAHLFSKIAQLLHGKNMDSGVLGGAIDAAQKGDVN